LFTIAKVLGAELNELFKF